MATRQTVPCREGAPGSQAAEGLVPGTAEGMQEQEQGGSRRAGESKTTGSRLSYRKAILHQAVVATVLHRRKLMRALKAVPAAGLEMAQQRRAPAVRLDN